MIWKRGKNGNVYIMVNWYLERGGDNDDDDDEVDGGDGNGNQEGGYVAL